LPQFDKSSPFFVQQIKQEAIQ